MTGVTLRDGSAADFPAIARVWRDSLEATGLATPEECCVERYLDRLRGETWQTRLACDADESAVGFLAFEPAQAWVRQLFATPMAQRRGIGALLLEEARRAMPEGFWLRTDLENAVARRFYERHGMVFEGERPRPAPGVVAAVYGWRPERVSSAAPLAYDGASKDGGRGLDKDALRGTGVTSGMVRANLTAPALVAFSLAAGEGRLSAEGALLVQTGVHTGRSVADKFVVDEPETSVDVWWGKINQKLAPEHFASLSARVRAYLAGRTLYTQDLFAGADPAHRVRVRLVTTGAWHALFARNMFIRPSDAELAVFEPDYVILHAPDLQADPPEDGVRSGTAIALSFAQKLIVIAGTVYGGEIKKSIFTVMNWVLPQQGVLPMHCSANIGADGDTALFFGLSGTGKTTLSSDPTRKLIGDDEHGWASDGVFNFEGGCYAKVINLSAEAEPEIFAASHRFGTVLENVVADARGRVDLADGSLTENTRACYPIEFVPNAELSGRGGKPHNVMMLTADAFGVLPPISKLTPAQAMYHFLSGYTARVAGTEKGLGKEPQATFSTCFGAPFLPRAPEVYGKMLEALIARDGADCWLVNTGWTGGAYGTGNRMSISHTRTLLRAALDGTLARGGFTKDPHFGLMIPASVPGVPDVVLDPRRAWADPAAYDAAARALVARFEANFETFAGVVGEDVRAAAVRAAA